MFKSKRNFQSLTNTSYDALVIGAGINGAGIAWDLSLRGLKVALIDKGDFGAETSAACFKILHGGLRYLQHADFPRLFRSVREQQILRKIAPNFITPLPFLVPCYGHGMKGRSALNLGVSIYELLARNRNRGVTKELRLSDHKVLSAKECLEIAPYLSRDGLTGGIVFYDAQISSCERFTLAVVASAQTAGAAVCNYVEAVGFESIKNQEGKSINSVDVKDNISGANGKITAKYFINATGPWVDKLLSFKKNEEKTQTTFSAGFQIAIPRIVDNYSLAVESRSFDGSAVVSRGGRSFFLQPWENLTLIGTTDSLYRGNPEAFQISEKDVSDFVRDVHEAYPSSVIKDSNVCNVFGGLRPIDQDFNLNNPDSHAAASRTDEIIFQKNKLDFLNLISVKGVKYTTFRYLSERVGDLVVAELGVSDKRSKTSETRLITATSIEDSKLKRLLKTHGSFAKSVFELCEKNPKLNVKAINNRETLLAECVYAIEHEMAYSVDDVVKRRTSMDFFGKLSSAELNEIASALAPFWNK